MIKIAAFVGKVSELRKALARHRDFLEKEKAPTVAAVGANKVNSIFHL